jgi:hypothetical protein
MPDGESVASGSLMSRLETHLLRFLTLEFCGIPMALVVCAGGAVALGLVLAWNGSGR